MKVTALITLLWVAPAVGWVLTPRPPKLHLSPSRSRTTMNAEEAEEWDLEIVGIAERYLQGKYTACDLDGGNCRAFCDRDEVTAILQEILPPVSANELKTEVNEVMALFGDEREIDMSEFIEALRKNKFWVEAGELVVKELIYLDALQSMYVSKKSLLNDDDYDELKDSLTWEGSALVTMSGNEAQFLFAAAANRKGVPVMEDSEYAALKDRLQAQQSWVVNRAQDPLEKLGLNTLVGYFHRSFKA